MALVEAGYTVVSCDNAGMETWGNDQAMLRMAQAFNYLRSQPGVLDEPMVMIGQSMGALNSLVYAHTYPLNTRCVIGLIPVIDVTDIHSNNRGGLAATINGCYAGGWSELVYGADKNPATMAAAGQLDDMPIQLWYGASDTLCLPTLAADFVTNSGCEGHSIAGGHAESTMNETAIPPAALIEFIEAAG